MVQAQIMKLYNVLLNEIAIRPLKADRPMNCIHFSGIS